MVKKNKRLALLMVVILMAATTLSCSLLSSPGAGTTSEVTPTPTDFVGSGVATPTDPNDPCANLSGTLELQLLIGPSEAVGLSPYTFATIPFQVVQEGNAYLVTGSGAVDYYEDILTADWGSFAVTFDGVTSVTGDCVSSDETGTLNVLIEMTGQQMIVVTVEGVEYSYPWEGSPQVEATFPLMDGAQVSGEGWLLILHLD